MSKLYVNTIYPQSGDQVALSGNLHVSGTLNAYAFNTIVHDTTEYRGSNVFGNSAADTHTFEGATVSPNASDGVPLGTTSLMWSDLFLASGAVVNFNAGDVTATHSSNTLTIAGGTLATAALTTSTIVASGIVKTDDATEATSTTDGSLQTDGGLSVAKSAVIGDDLDLLSDSSIFAMGLGQDFTITHDGTTGATLAGNPVHITAGGASTWKATAGALLIDSEASTVTVDGHTGVVITSSNSGEVDITSAAAVDINATTGVTIDGVGVTIGAGSGFFNYYNYF